MVTAAGAGQRSAADGAAGSRLTPENHHLAVGLASVPDKIRGFGYIKMRNIAAAKESEAALWEEFRSGPAPLLKAAETSGEAGGGWRE